MEGLCFYRENAVKPERILARCFRQRAFFLSRKPRDSRDLFCCFVEGLCFYRENAVKPERILARCFKGSARFF